MANQPQATVAPVVASGKKNDGNLRLPSLINDLITSGRWPSTTEASLRQNVVPLASAERVSALAEGEEWLYLYPPPFRSVAADVTAHETRGWSAWAEHGALHELDPAMALIIGDFGLGSDAPILLDYRHDGEPRVLKLAWSQADRGGASVSTTTWVEIARSFDDFATRLGLA